MSRDCSGLIDFPAAGTKHHKRRHPRERRPLGFPMAIGIGKPLSKWVCLKIGFPKS